MDLVVVELSLNRNVSCVFVSVIGSYFAINADFLVIKVILNSIVICVELILNSSVRCVSISIID